MFKHLGSILQNTKDLGVFDFVKLVDNWKEIVGHSTALHTSPLKLERGVLVIITDHSSFSSVINLLGEELKNRIFMRYPNFRGKIKSFRFQVNSEFFKNQNQKERISTIPHKKSPRYILSKREGEQLFTFVEDNDLKEKLISLFVQSTHQHQE